MNNYAYSFPKECRKAQKKVNDLVRSCNKDPTNELILELDISDTPYDISNGKLTMKLDRCIKMRIIDYNEYVEE